MNPSARSALTLAVLLVLPQLQALCPRLAPDVISGKVIPCRYLCIKINFLELPSIILSTERDGVLCSTLLLRRRGVCKNGGCIPFGSDDDIKPKGALGKVIAAIDKFASGSYRQKAPKPGTPFGPIVSTATSLFGGGSSTTSGGTSSAASSIVATATAAAVGSSLKKLFSESTSASSENKRRNERPTLNPFGPSLPSIPKPDHPANTPGITLPSSSGAVAVNFGGGPPIAPPSTEGGAENVGTHATPGAPIINSGAPSAHPTLAPFINPQPPKQKDSLSPGSPSHVSNSGGAITKAIGIVLGNLREMSGTPTSGIPSGQQTSGGPAVASKHHLDSSIRDFTKTTGVAQNAHIREATGGSGAAPAAFPVGGIPPIVQPSSSSGTDSDGKEIFGAAPVSPAVTDFGYKSKLPNIPSSPSRLPSIETRAPGAASREGSTAGSQLNSPYGEAFARLKEISQDSNRNPLPGQPLRAAFGETLVPSRPSSVITLHKTTSNPEVNHNKGTVINVPRTGATPIATDHSHGSRTILPLTGGVAEREREETSQWPETPKKVSRPLNAVNEAGEVLTGTLRAPSLLPTLHPVRITSPSKGIASLKPPPTKPTESSSGSLANVPLAKALNTLKRVSSSATPVISVRQPSPSIPSGSSEPTNNSPISISHESANEPEIKPPKAIAVGPLHGNPTHAAVVLNGGALPNAPSTLAAAEKKGAKAFQPSTAPDVIQRPTVIATKTAELSLTNPRGLSEVSTNKPSDKPSPSIGNSPAELSAAMASTSATSSGVKRTFGGVLKPLKRLSDSTAPTMLLRKPPLVLMDNTSKPSAGSRILRKDATGSKVKPTEETVLGALDGSRTNAAVKLGGGAPSDAPSTVAQTERGGAEASRLSAAPSKISRPALIAVTRVDASTNNVRGPSQISTNHGTEPSPSIGSTGLEVTAASQSTTAVRSRKKKTFRKILNAFRRARIATTSHFRPTSQVATNATSKPSESSSIPSSRKGASHPEVKQSKTTVSGVLPGNPPPRNVQIGSGAPPPSPPVMNAAGINPARTTPSSAAEKSALRSPKVVPETSEAGTTNIEHNSQARTNNLINGPVSSNKNAELEFPRASPPSSSSGNPIEKGLAGTSSTLRRISEDSATLTTSKKSSLVAPTEKLKPIIDTNKRVSGPQKSDIKAEIKGALRGSAAIIPASVGNHPPIFPSSNEKSPKTKSMGVAQEPAVPLLRPISAAAGMAVPSSSRIEAYPQVTNSIPANRPLLSMKTAPVQPGNSSRNLSSAERLQLNLPTPGTAPSPNEQSPESDAGKPKQSKDSQAHSPHSAATAKATKTLLNISRSILARPDVAYGSRASVLGGVEPAGETSTSITLAPSKKTVSGEAKGTKNAIPPPLSIGSVVTAGLASLPESKKGSAGKPSVSTSDSSNLPLVTIVSDVLRHSKLNQQKHSSGSQSTRNEGIKESVASSSRDLGSTKPKTGTLLNSGAKGSMLSGLSVVVQPTAPNVLLTTSHSRDRSSSAIGSKSQERKSHDVQTKIANNSIASVLAKLNGELLFKPKEKRTNTYDGNGSAENNLAHVKSTSHGGVEAKVIDRINGLSRKEDQLQLSNNIARISELGSLSSPIGSKPSKVPIVPINSSVQTAVAQRNQRAHHQKKNILTIVPTGTGTADRSPNSRKEYESINKPNSNSASATAPNGKGAPRNTVSPNSPVPATHVSVSSAAATGTKNPESGISPISHVNTAASPSKTTATSGLALSAHAGKRLLSRPITDVANQAPPAAAASKIGNLSNGSNQGSETRGPMNAMANLESTRENIDAKSSTSSRNTSSSSGRFESKMPPHTDVSTKASSVSTVKGMDSTSSLPLEKQSSSSTAHPVSIPSSVSAALGTASASSVSDVRAAHRTADTLKSTAASEKHTRTAGSLPNPKGSVPIEPAAEGFQTPRPPPGTPTKTKGDAYNSRTSGPQAGFTTSATSLVPAQTLETRGTTSGSTASIPSTATASKIDSRNTSPEAPRNEVMKVENVTTPGSPSHLAKSTQINSAPQNVQEPRLPAATTASESVQNARTSASPFSAKADFSEGNASTNAKTSEGPAGSLEKAGMKSKNVTASTLSLTGQNAVPASPITPKQALKPQAKYSKIIKKLGSLSSGPRGALKLSAQSGSSAVPNLRSETAKNHREGAVTEAKPTTVAPDLTQPAASQTYSPHSTLTASSGGQTTQNINAEQPTPNLYTGMQSPGGIVFGSPHTIPGGFWGPGQTIPGIFRPF